MDEPIRIGFWRPEFKPRPKSPMDTPSGPDLQNLLDGYPSRYISPYYIEKYGPEQAYLEHVVATELDRMRARDRLPWPEPTDWDPDERSAVLIHLERGDFKRRGYMGSSRCRICGILNGSEDVTDGVFLWPSGLTHYVEMHSIGLPAEFILHAQLF